MHKRNTTVTAFILLTIATATFGEISFFPFKSGFRFGLGSTVYFLGIILYPELLKLWVGAGIGLTVVVFRVGLDLVFTPDPVGLASLLNARLPALTYYLLLTLLAKLFKAAQYRDRPLLLGLMVSVFDLFSNSFEYLVWNRFNIGGYELGEIGIVALLKGFIIIGVVSIFSVYKLRIVQEQERLRFERLLLLASGLYQETFFLRKAMGHIEKITAKSFEIYQQLKREGQGKGLSGLALEVSEEVHEIKKDVQRVVAGLTKLVNVKPEAADMSLEEIFDILIRTNLDYSRSLNREIEISADVKGEVKITRIYPVVSVLNNLITNAIEAMAAGGSIRCEAKLNSEWLHLRVTNDGPPIPIEEQELVFKPGFTTKYNLRGVASTGIGLTHVLDIMELLHGRVELKSVSDQTEFILHIPLAQV